MKRIQRRMFCHVANKEERSCHFEDQQAAWILDDGGTYALSPLRIGPFNHKNVDDLRRDPCCSLCLKWSSSLQTF